MGESSVLSLRLDPGLKRQLDKLAQATRRSRSYLAAEAIREYVALNAWRWRRLREPSLRRTAASSPASGKSGAR